jgi:16S rRNA (guanine527-N7)-methyltransferase
VVAAAAEVGVPLTDAQAEALVRFAALLRRWNAVHNLTAVEPADILTHHLLDSLAILPSIYTIFPEKALTLLDVGAGGGLPGVPLALAEPAFSVSLVDKVAKKAAFLTQAIVELSLRNAQALNGRVETLQLPPFDLVVSRAFASLAEFVRLTRHLVKPRGWWAAMKGVLPRAEIEELRRAHPEVRAVDAIKLDIPRLGAERHLILLQRP